MKIVIITETFLPSIDGVVTRLTEAVKYLQKHNHSVVIVAPDLGVKEYKGAVVVGVKATTMPFYRHRPFALPQRKVKDLLIKYNPDIVHVVNPALIGASGVYYARKLGFPIVASYHTHIPKYLDHYKLYKPLRPLFWKYFRSLHNMANLNLCTSNTIQEELVSKKFHNVHLWKRGVDIQKYHPTNFSQQMRNQLSQGNPNKKLLLFVGRLAAEKEIEKLKPMMDMKSDIQLAIIGDGPEIKRLKSLFAETNTVFTGFMKGKQLAQAFASADALIFPSVTETLGLVILEAMASGLPVIAAKSGPTMEQIIHNKTGLLYEHDNIDSMIHAVSKLDNKQFVNHLKQHARMEAEKFNWTSPSKQLVEFYQQVLLTKSTAQTIIYET